MRRITGICLVFLGVSVLHNIYLFSTNDEDDDDFGIEPDDTDSAGLVSRFVSSSIRRVKRRIFYRNETLPAFDPAVFGNNTGRNNTISLIKLLNKNYYVIKKRYYEILANKSMKAPPKTFKGKDFQARKKAEAAAKKAAEDKAKGGTPAPGPGPGGAAPEPTTAAPAG